LRKYLNGQWVDYRQFFENIIPLYKLWCEDNEKDAGKYAQLTRDILEPLLKGYHRLVKKFNSFWEHLSFLKENPDLKESFAVFLTHGSIRKYLTNFFAYRWKKGKGRLNPSWVRDTIRGWRDKLDKEMTIFGEPGVALTGMREAYHDIGDQLRAYRHDETYHKLISTLEKYKALHLFLDCNLLPVLERAKVSEEVKALYTQLYAKIKNDTNFQQSWKKALKNEYLEFYATELTAHDLQIGIRDLAQSVKGNLLEQKLKIEGMGIEVLKKGADTLSMNFRYLFKFGYTNAQFEKKLLEFLNSEKYALTALEKETFRTKYLTLFTELKEEFLSLSPTPAFLKAMKNALKAQGRKRSVSYTKIETFLRKIHYLQTHLLVHHHINQKKEVLLNPEYQNIFTQYLPGARFTEAIGSILENQSPKYSNLTTALRGIIALAYAAKYNYFGKDGIVQRIEGLTTSSPRSTHFDPSKISSFPFQSPRRTKLKIPFNTKQNNPFKLEREEYPWKNEIRMIPKSFKKISDEIRANIRRNYGEDEPLTICIDAPVHNPATHFLYYCPQCHAELDSNFRCDNQDCKAQGHRIAREHTLWLIKKGRRATLIPLEVPITAKQRDCIEEGANISHLQVLVPEAPAYNIEIGMVLNAPTRKPFKHSTKYMQEVDDRFSQLALKRRQVGTPTYAEMSRPSDLPHAVYLSSDFNEIGENMIALGTPGIYLDLTGLNRYFHLEKYKKKRDAYEKIGSRLQHKIGSSMPPLGSIPLLIKQKAEKRLRAEGKMITDNSLIMKIASDDRLLDRLGRPFRKIKAYRLQYRLLKRKQAKLMRDALIKVCMIYAYIARKTGASYFGWDEIQEMSTKGLSGRLATAVSYLPRQDGLKGLFIEWLQDLGILPDGLSDTPREYVREVGAIPATSAPNADEGPRNIKENTIRCSVDTKIVARLSIGTKAQPSTVLRPSSLKKKRNAHRPS
jgi:hypothetical protein